MFVPYTSKQKHYARRKPIESLYILNFCISRFHHHIYIYICRLTESSGDRLAGDSSYTGGAWHHVLSWSYSALPFDPKSQHVSLCFDECAQCVSIACPLLPRHPVAQLLTTNNKHRKTTKRGPKKNRRPSDPVSGSSFFMLQLVMVLLCSGIWYF